MAVARQIIGIGAAHRAEQQLVAHRPAVDEEILAERIGAREGRQRGEALDAARPRARRASSDRVGAEVGAQHVGEPRQTPRRAGQRRRPGDGRALLAREREGDIGPAHGKTAHDIAHGLGFGAVGLEEFQPRRRGVEQVAHLDPGALAERRRHRSALGAAFDRQAPRRAARPHAAWRWTAAPPRRSTAAPRRESRACEWRAGRRRRASRWHGAQPRARDRRASCRCRRR